MSLLDDGAFLAHFSQSKVSAKQQVNSMIDAIYAKVMLDLELWLNKHQSNEAKEIESDYEENVPDHNLHGELPNCQPTPPEPLQPTHSLTSHFPPIVKKEIVDEVEVDSQVIQNEQSTNDRRYLPVDIEIGLDNIPNMANTRFHEFDSHEVSNLLPPNALSQQPHENNQKRMHFDDDLEIDQETLDEVKRKIEEEENMKERENELEPGDVRPNEAGDRMQSDDSEVTESQSINGHVQQEESDTTREIGEKIGNESTTNSTQPNLAQPNRQFQCPHCTKSFGHRSTLRQHFRVHTGERPFKCDQCDKSFSHYGNLTQHQLIHQNIKRFQCDQCDKKFVLKVQLDNHLRTHSGERPFQCRFCDKPFTALGARSRHEQAKHHHVKPYRCKVCGLTATIRTNVITHVRVAHFGLPPTIKQQRERNIIDDRDPRELVEKV